MSEQALNQTVTAYLAVDGATAARPLRDEPYGRTGDVLDPFSHRWSVLKVNPDSSPKT